MELQEFIYNNAYKKMWLVSFIIFASAYLIIQILPDSREIKKEPATRIESGNNNDQESNNL